MFDDDWDDEDLNAIDEKYMNLLGGDEFCDDDDDDKKEEEYVDGLWNGLTTARISDTLILGADKETTTDTPGTRLDAPLVYHHGNCVSKFSLMSCGSDSTSSSVHPFAGDAFILCEILSRLPVKSLMRFKCVCKPWQFLIEKDSYFIHLQSSRSKTTTSILIRKWNSLLLADLSLPPSVNVRQGRSTFQREVFVDPCRILMLPPVNGLICLLDKRNRSVCVKNPSTGESSPWIKSTIKPKEIDDHVSYYNCGVYGFGYDPANKEHKVLAMWIIRRCYFVCEVLTVGKHLNQWRRIDDAPHVTANELGGNYVHTNGSIYWFHSDVYEALPRIIEFNLNSERFKVISLPNFIIQDVISPYQTQLIEVDGRLAVLALKIRYLSPGSTYWSKNNNPSMKMCIFHDGGQDTISTSIQGSRSFNGYYWTEDTFSMPPFAWKPERLDTILPIQGTDVFLIKPKDDQFSFYYYNWKKKIFSSSKLEIEGISSFFKKSYQYSTPFAEFYAFTETLLPVN